jgi:hypothetical protein
MRIIIQRITRMLDVTQVSIVPHVLAQATDASITAHLVLLLQLGVLLLQLGVMVVLRKRCVYPRLHLLRLLRELQQVDINRCIIPHTSLPTAHIAFVAICETIALCKGMRSQHAPRTAIGQLYVRHILLCIANALCQMRVSLRKLTV